MRVLKLVVFLSALAATHCFKAKETPASPVLRYDPADLYTSSALEMAEAVRRQDPDGLAKLAAEHPEAVNSAGRKDIPLLAWAMGHEDFAATDILLQAGANPNVTFPIGDWKMSLASLSASMENPRFLDLLLAHGMDPAGVTDTEPPIFSAIKARRYDRVESLLRAGANINQQDSAGKTAIIMMALTGDYAQVLAFVKRGADPHISMTNGTTLKRLITKFPAQDGTPQRAAQRELLALLSDSLHSSAAAVAW